jgi:hypothetical protein
MTRDLERCVILMEKLVLNNDTNNIPFMTEEIVINMEHLTKFMMSVVYV